jgi:ssDNA-binding Zn-finger/Zn-ribbon topoisomerase 1
MPVNANLKFTVLCEKCGEPVAIRQPDAENGTLIFVSPCLQCVKRLVLKLIRHKRDEFSVIYDRIRDSALDYANEENGDETGE